MLPFDPKILTFESGRFLAAIQRRAMTGGTFPAINDSPVLSLLFREKAGRLIRPKAKQHSRTRARQC